MQSDRTQRLNVATARTLVDACVQAGIDHFFVAPGSRSTPLALALAGRSDATVVRHFDERGLAFACLGYARATGRCGAIICTSGTAVANMLPAVIEASLDHVPMLVLSADRPPEMRDLGHNQTIDQTRLFGEYVRWFADLPCPAEEIPSAFWSSSVFHAVTRSCDGPVHLNWMVREPFGSPPEDSPASPLVRKNDNRYRPPASEVAEWTPPSGPALVVAGGCHREEALAARRLADRLNAPFLSDITNGVRGDLSPLLLEDRQLAAPEVIVHVGQRIVSKRWLGFLRARPPRHYIHLTRFSSRQDPALVVTETRHGELISLCDRANTIQRTSEEFRRPWVERGLQSRAVIDEFLGRQQGLTEPGTAWELAALLPDDSALFLGNSLSIREWDSFAFWPESRVVHVGANRGASGIDGLLGTSVGFAQGHRKRTTVVLGDLSALHDLNSLALLASSTTPTVVVLMNNDGGGIFHFLPIAEESGHFEPYFVMPHGRTFEAAARMFDIEYHAVRDLSTLRSRYRDTIARPRTCLLEVMLDRRATRTLHEQLEHRILAAGEAS